MARSIPRGPDPRFGTGFALVALLIGLLAAVTWWNTSRLIDAARWVEHSRRVMADLDGLYFALADAESSQRGYLITGLPSHLEPYRADVASVDPAFDRLRSLLSDNADQSRSLEELRKLVSERRATLEENIALRDQSGIEAAAAAIAAGAGRATMNAIHALIGRMQADEQRLLHERRESTASLARTAIVTLSLGGLLLFVLLGLIWFILQTDFSRRRAAEEEVRQSEEELRTTLRSIGDAVIATDRIGRVTLLNPVAESLTGFTEAEAVGRDSAEVFHIVNEETRAVVESPIARVLREGVVVGLANHTVLVSRSGREFPIADSGAPIRASSGEVSGVVLVFRDITEERVADRELQRLAAIVASSEDAIVAEDLEGRVTAWNAAAERLFGYSSREMIGRLTALLEPDEASGNTARQLARIREGEQVLQFDTTGRRKDGSTVAVSIRVSPILDAEGRTVGASKIARDITERKRVERQQQAAREAAEDANRAKDRFLAVLSHELRTPLTPALATAQVLERRGGLPEEIARSLRLIRRNIELEALLVDDLLDLTRIAHGKLELRLEPTDVHALLESVVELCRSDSRARRQSLTLELGASEHHADADPSRLQQVFWNLLKNAVKFTGEGGAIQVSTENPRPGDLRIAVADSGIGLSPAVRERIFEPFEQAASRSSTRYGGLGLGLSISRTLVELHKGKIHAESAGEGKGTTFYVDLPAHVERAVSRPAAPSGDVRVPPRPLSILVVEDHPDTASSLAQLLETEGHTVRIAASVGEGERLFRERPCDLVITDLGLPDASGHELLGRLRAIQPVQAVVLSGYAMDADIVASRAAGFLEHLTKPINVRKLLSVISQVGSRKTSAV